MGLSAGPSSVLSGSTLCFLFRCSLLDFFLLCSPAGIQQADVYKIFSPFGSFGKTRFKPQSLIINNEVTETHLKVCFLVLVSCDWALQHFLPQTLLPRSPSPPSDHCSCLPEALFAPSSQALALLSKKKNVSLLCFRRHTAIL